MATTGNTTDGKPNLKLKTRLMAWWEGYDLSGLKGRPGDGAGEGGHEDPKRPPRVPGEDRWGKPLWSANRIEVAEKLWGPGFTSPGGMDHVPYLVKPLGLNPAMSVLDLSAGLGGASRVMASQYGCWVTGLETSPLLVKEGQERSFREGLEKKAEITTYDPEQFSWPKRVDAVFSKEAMYTVRDKEQLFDGIEMALKPRGQVVMTDYVVDMKLVNPEKVMAWSAKEAAEPHLWTTDQMRNAFAQRNLDMRIAEDMTDLHRQQIKAALQAFLMHLERHSMDAETKIAVMKEIELWANRMAILDSGVRCYRFYAIKPAE